MVTHISFIRLLMVGAMLIPTSVISQEKSDEAAELVSVGVKSGSYAILHVND